MEKIDVLYVMHFRPVLGRAERLTNSIRSIDKHLSNIGNVYVVGYDVSSIFKSSIINVVCPLATKRNINDLKYVHSFANLESISDNFLLIDEANFLCNDYDASDMPFCCHTKVLNNEEETTMINTYKVLRKNYLSVNNFNSHAPMLFNKSCVKKLFSEIDFPSTDICIKTVYANYFKKRFDFFVPMVFENALIDKATAIALLRRRNMFCVKGTTITVNMMQLLYTLYPKKSKWEL